VKYVTCANPDQFTLEDKMPPTISEGNVRDRLHEFKGDQPFFSYPDFRAMNFTLLFAL
jgi:hypothetical protein